MSASVSDALRVWLRQFFRLRLLALDREQVVDYLNDLDSEAKALKAEILKLCWFMRGGLTYDEGMMLSQQEKDMIIKLVNDNLDTTKESGMPFF